MRHFLLCSAILISFWAAAQKSNSFFSFGLDHRQYPIDIENVSRGPSIDNNGLPDDDRKFWSVNSIHVRYGIIFGKNWLISSAFYGRYNLLHRREEINYLSPAPTVLEWPPGKIKEKKIFKYDFFLDI